MRKPIAEHVAIGMAGVAHIDEKTRRANRRLAIILGLVALGFYLTMLFFSP